MNWLYEALFCPVHGIFSPINWAPFVTGYQYVLTTAGYYWRKLWL
jgi:hypothetical protein